MLYYEIIKCKLWFKNLLESFDTRSEMIFAQRVTQQTSHYGRFVEERFIA